MNRYQYNLNMDNIISINLDKENVSITPIENIEYKQTSTNF